MSCVSISHILQPPFPAVVMLITMWILEDCNFELTDNGKTNSKGERTSAYQKANVVKVPKIYWNLTRKAVLTMEWIDGIKLTDEAGLKKVSLKRKELIDKVLYFLQFLCLFFFYLYSLVVYILLTHHQGRRIFAKATLVNNREPLLIEYIKIVKELIAS